MAKKKYYAVKRGKTPGIYHTWDECKAQVDGFSGAGYKSFGTLEEAQNYLNENLGNSASNEDKSNIVDQDALIAYVDGSYNDATKEFSYGMVTIHNGKEEYFSEKMINTDLAEMHNVAGEIKGAEAAMRYAVAHKYKKLIIYHDYEGIAKWCTGEWQAKKDGTKAYQEYFDSIKENIDINFVKVLGHSNNKYNDMADELAKQAIFGSDVVEKREAFKNKDLKDNVYISRDLDELNDLLLNEGNIMWESFLGKGIKNVGQQQRFTFLVDGKEAFLDIYQRTDGSTTFHPTGVNIEYSKLMKAAIEKCGLRNTSENKNYTIFLGKEWLDKTLEYLGQLPGVNSQESSSADNRIYQFTSKKGDKLTLSVYGNYKVTVQGKPLYLYNEFRSIASYSPQVSVDNLVDMTNAFVDTNVTASDTRVKMNEILPKAYNSGKIDETIWKLFSPSVVFIEEEKELEDYSGCVFPALRALEAYLLYLLDCKGITVNRNFGIVFGPQTVGSGTYVVLPKYRVQINDVKYEQALERIYNYFHKTRHVLFHADQILINTRLIEEKQEAQDIFNEIVTLIEETFIDVEIAL